MFDTLLLAALIVFGVIPPAFIIVMLLGTRHEGWQGSLNPEPPTWIAAAARRVTGLYVRLPTVAAKSSDLQRSP